MRRLTPALLAALALAAALPGLAGASPLVVVAQPGLGTAVLDRLAARGAVGLLVPDAGPTTSEARAIASLERGEVVNSLRGRPPSGPVLVSVRRGGHPAPPYVLVGVPSGGEQPNDRRYAIVLVGGRRGLLGSASTRIPGLVAVADVAHGRLKVTPSYDPARELRALDRRIRDNRTSQPPASALAALAVVVVALARPRNGLLALGALAAANLVLGAAGVSRPWLAAALLAVAPLAALALPRRPAWVDGALLGAVVALHLVVMAADASWLALSPLGPTQNARFYGLSNLLETILLAPALAAAALLWRRLGWAGFGAVALVALVTVAGSRFGADGGGALVLAAGFAVLAAALLGGGRRAALLGAALAALAVAVVGLDALAGPSTHVGEALRGGPGQVARDLADRVSLSWRRATASLPLAAAVGAALAALVALAARGPRGPLPTAVAAAVAVSLVVNDSPKEVALGGFVALLVVSRFAAADAAHASDGV